VQATTASPGTPVVKHGSWKHGRTTIAVAAAFNRAPLATLAAVDWVDLLIIGLMLLAAVHGLRLGALVQLLTFAGFFLGFLLGTKVWVPLLSRGHADDVTRSVLVVSLVLFTAFALGYAGRVIGTWSNATVRRHHLGNVDAVLGVGVAVVAVLLSVWIVAAVILSPNSRFTSLVPAVARSDILHSIDGVLPAPSIFNDLQTFLNDQGFPQVFSTLTPPSTPSVSTPTNAETTALADPAVFSTVKVLGTACSTEQEGSGFVVGPGLVATNAHVVAGEGSGDTQVLLGNSAYNATPVLFDPDFDLAVLRTDAPLGPALTISPNLVARGTLAAFLGYPEDGGLNIGAAGVTEEVTAIGKDIYNSGSVTRGVYALDANVEPGNSGGPLLGPGGQVIGVVFSRSTVYQDVGYALTSPGVLTRVQQAEQHHSAVGTGPCISG
jgi:S1-C subfamily serine protease